MTTLITRDQMRPGQIVQRVTTQTYRVRSARWSADNHHHARQESPS